MLDAEKKGADLAVEPEALEGTVVVKELTREELGQDVAAILDALTRPPTPAPEVITLLRSEVESVLRELEDSQAGISSASPSQNIRTLREAVSLPQEQLWAVHSVGPNEIYPVFSKEDGEQRAQEIRDACANARNALEARGERVAEYWPEITVNVVPSPWEPAEHFEVLARQWCDDAEHLRAALQKKDEAPAPESGSIEA